MAERRALFEFGILYSTPPDTVERIPGIVREIIESVDQTRFDRAHLKGFGNSSLKFEVVYYVLVPDSSEDRRASRTPLCRLRR